MIGTEPANAVFHHGQLKNLMIRNLFFSHQDNTKGQSKVFEAYPRQYLWVFHLLWVLGAACVWRGSPKGLVRNLLMQIFTVGSSNV